MFNKIQDKKITFGLSDFLKEFTSEHDVLNILIKEGFGDLKEIINRQIKVDSEQAREALEKLTMIAISNCENKMEYCRVMLGAFEDLIKEKQERIKKENTESGDR